MVKLLALALTAALVPLAAAAAVDAPAGWKLVWSDEFDYEGLPDPKKWDYEEGFVRNREMQYYTRARKENARVEDGVLVIEGRKERLPNPRYQEGSKSWQRNRRNAEYTSAAIITLGKAAWRYGRIEVRAKLPRGKGMWPAIWTLGANRSKIRWPGCGEIDIMEFVGKDPRHVHGNAHYGVNGKHRSKHGKHRTKAPYDDFHVYAIEWFPDRIDFFFDKTKYHTFRIDDAGKGNENAFRKPHYLLINLAIGGSWGGPVDDKVLPQKYLVDYVRVYEERPASTR
ncbi:MAG: glycoside hydrolase family 16 protein [Planctomycetota bacterium]|jgi:beta-glucanase (GH16 family)